MKKLLILAMILALALAFTACGNDDDDDTNGNGNGNGNDVTNNQPPADNQPPVEPDVPDVPDVPAARAGYNWGFVRDGDGGSSFDIIIGAGRDAWPFADAQPADEDGAHDGGRLFDPVPGATYRISYNVQSDGDAGAGGWRVRWMSTSYGYPTYTPGDAEVVNAYEVAPGQVATVIPAHFNQGFAPGGRYTLVVEITLDGDQSYNELIGNITLRGTAGSSEWFARGVTVERLTGGHGSDVAEVVLEWTHPTRG